jgi:cytochrome c551/c552
MVSRPTRTALGWSLAAVAALAAACSHANDAENPANDAGVGDASSPPPVGADGGSAPADAGSDAVVVSHDSGSDAGADAAAPATCVTPATPQSCAAPKGTALPICNLSQTGCMDPAHLTRVAANAVYYEVNSPLWSDDAAKWRAFVLPKGATVHVKNCMPDAGASALAECVSPAGVPNGPADTGKWVFPVGTVMIKSFAVAGKLVETRLFMHVDATTAALIGNGTDWVGYTYAWNESQTEATVVPNQRVAVTFDAGSESVSWNYPSQLDCVGCHTAAVGTIGPETGQMNRDVDGGNQIDRFVAMGLFDTTAPAKPYAPALVEPYANPALGLQGPPAGATVEQEARSYLSANCGFCHRPDVNDQGFDLRYSLSFAQTGICNLTLQNGSPGMTNQTYADLAPGNHAASAVWIRMNIPVPASDPDELVDVGRMPSVASFVVDPQAVSLIGSWIDGMKDCPDAGP